MLDPRGSGESGELERALNRGKQEDFRQEFKQNELTEVNSHPNEVTVSPCSWVVNLNLLMSGVGALWCACLLPRASCPLLRVTCTLLA